MNNIGETLSKEKWITAKEHLEIAAPLLAEIIRKINIEGKGEQDAMQFLNEMLLAVAAMCYVAEFATDKCIFTTQAVGG